MRKLYKRTSRNSTFYIFFAIVVFSLNFSNASLIEIEKYEKWKEAIEKPEDYEKVFLFFYKNPHWPLFEESVKIAERNIKSNSSDKIALAWFKKYLPKTANGIKFYAKTLLKTSPKFAEKYIKQTWIFQNLSSKFAKEYRKEFEKDLTEIDDAKRAKRLIKQKKYEELRSMQKYVGDEVAKYISRYLESLKNKLIQKGLYDIDNRYNVVKNYIDKNNTKVAAKILTQTNLNEELNANKFFSQRRRVACDVLRSGNPKLAYKILTMNKLDKKINGEEYSKAEWLMGFISYRFLGKPLEARKHFENAYSHCRNPIRISKNAFWAAETCRAKNDILLALEWYRKAEKHFNTFYGYIARYRLLNLARGRFSLAGDFYEGEKEYVSPETEALFQNRELVRVLTALSKSNANMDKALLAPFYKRLIDEIEDPREEVLILSLASSDEELRYIIAFASAKQLYFNNRKAYKILDYGERTLISRVNPNPCFMSLVHAIIHRESAFNEKAKSHAGAIGLMQIMPSTAEYEAKKIKFYVGDLSLFNRQKNIVIGANIINRLLKKYNNNLGFAIPAYNCGEGNIKKFKKSLYKFKNLTCIDIIELMPIKESRIYTKHVLHSFFIYQKIFNAQSCYNCLDILDLK